MNAAKVLDDLKRRFPNEPEYHQAVEEVLSTIEEEYNKRLSNQVRGACNNAAYFIARKLKKFMIELHCLLLEEFLKLQQIYNTI